MASRGVSEVLSVGDGLKVVFGVVVAEVVDSGGPVNIEVALAGVIPDPV